MSYYDTIDDDIERAKAILADGAPRASNPDADIEPLGATILGRDVYAAYKLLESFVAEIARLHDRLQIDPGGSDRIDELEAALQQLDLWRAGAEDSAKAVDELVAERDQLRAQIVALERESDAAGQGWAECIELNKRQGEVLHHEGIEHSECQAALITAQAEIADYRRSFELYHTASMALMHAYTAAHPEVPENVWPDATTTNVWAAAEITRLRALVDAVGPKVCELALRHQKMHGNDT